MGRMIQISDYQRGYVDGQADGYARGYEDAERATQARLNQYGVELLELNARLDALTKRLD